MTTTTPRRHLIGSGFRFRRLEKPPSETALRIDVEFLRRLRPTSGCQRTIDSLASVGRALETRGTQRRYTQLSRFNIFLPPDGKYTLLGPKSADLPRRTAGEYLLLLRIEASDDDVTGSNLAVVGAGPGIVNSGAVAGFPLPVLRYFVGAAGDSTVGIVRQLKPADNKTFAVKESVDFAWLDIDKAAFYQVEVTDGDGKTLVTALLPARVGTYRAPSWLRERAGENCLVDSASPGREWAAPR